MVHGARHLRRSQKLHEPRLLAFDIFLQIFKIKYLPSMFGHKLLIFRYIQDSATKEKYTATKSILIAKSVATNTGVLELNFQLFNIHRFLFGGSYPFLHLRH